MDSFYDFTQSVSSVLKSEFSKDKTLKIPTCKPIRQCLQSDDLGAIASNTPALLLAPISANESTVVDTGQTDCSLNIVLFLLVIVNGDETDNNKNKNNKNDQNNKEEEEKISVTKVELEPISQSILSRLATIIPHQRWGLSNCFPAKNIEMIDLFGLNEDDKPNLHSWRTGIAVINYAHKLLGNDKNPINTALWAITWEQVLRIGEIDPFISAPLIEQQTETTEDKCPVANAKIDVNWHMDAQQQAKGKVSTSAVASSKNGQPTIVEKTV